MSDLIERAEIISGMLKMGEPIKWGSDSTIIDELLAANAKMRKCLESIAAYHDERLSEVIPYGYNDETAMDTHKHCRDFARGGLK